MLDLRLILADSLKLRRRRGLMAGTTGLTLGAVTLVFSVLAIRHASDPAKYAPAGGAGHYADIMGVLSLLAVMVGTIVGGRAGADDVETGVFRDLVATGRSRMALYASRLPGALTVVLPLVAGAAALTAGAAFALAGDLPDPTAGEVARQTAAVLAAGTLAAAVAVGLSSLLGATGTVVGTVLAFHMGVSPILAELSVLGDARKAIPLVAITRLGEADSSGPLAMALVTAIAIAIAWAAVALGAGALRTTRSEW